MARFSDLDRPPLRQAALARALVVDGGLWREVHVVAETGSTNAEVAAAARAGAAEGLVVAAEGQTAGRGRLDRRWTAPARSGLTFSVLLRPGPAVPPQRHGWVPLLVGVAVAAAVRRVAHVDARVKWPNDVLVDGRKLAGVLVERVPGRCDGGGAGADALVAGVGLNVSLRAGELPVPEATSLYLAGAPTDRDPLLRAVLRSIADRYGAWRAVGGDPDAGADPLRAAYRGLSATLDRDVVAHLPGGRTVAGRALDVDPDGRLVVRTGSGTTPVAAGDVVHLR